MSVYNDRKTKKLRAWTRVLDIATAVILIVAATYIQFAFTAVLATWFRLLLGIVALTITLVNLQAAMRQIHSRSDAKTASWRNRNNSLDNRL